MPPVAPSPVIDPLKQFVTGAFTAGTSHPIPLVATHFDVEITGGIAAVTTLRRFRNDEAESIEATITFPLPVQAVLFGLETKVGGRVLKARAQARAQARETYEQAIEQGKATVLHEEVLRGVHMLSLAHIAPGDTIEVTTRWATTLTCLVEESRLRIPLTVGDIYGCSPLPDSDALVHGGPTQHASLTVRCADGAVTLEGGSLEHGTAEIALDAPIDLTVRGTAPRDLTGRAADGREVVLRIEPEPAADGRLDLAILADHSGSMGEMRAFLQPRSTKHHGLIEGLRTLAGCLGEEDAVDLWEFASAPRHIGSTVETPRTRLSAVLGLRSSRRRLAKLIDQLSSPAGGTEIGAAIDTVIRQSAARDILLITDGKSHALDVQALARHGRRVTVVLIGEDSLEADVGHLAALTGGDILVTGNDRIAEVLRAAVDGLRASRAESEEHAFPQRVRVRRGRATITALWRPDPPLAEDAAQPIISRAVAALAASLALPTLGRAEAARLAEAEGLVTHLTSLVLVDEDAEIQSGLPATRKIALATPRTLASDDLLAMPAFLRRIESRSDAYPAAAPPSPTNRSAFRPATPGARFERRLRSDIEFPAKEAASPASFVLDLSQLPAAIDWSGEGNRLLAGDLSQLEPAVRDLVQQAAALDVVKRAAERCQVGPVLLVVALIAGAADSNRNAARVRRAILDGRSSRVMDEAAKALNLLGRSGLLKRFLAQRS